MTLTDDRALLESMLSDWEAGGTKAAVTGDLASLYDTFTQQLLSESLDQLLTARVRGLTGVSAVDDLPSQYPALRLTRGGVNQGDRNREAVDDGERDSILTALRFVETHPDSHVLPYDLSLHDLEESAYRMCDMYGRLANAVPLERLEMGTTHNPDHTFVIDGRRYSYLFLYYYLYYAYCAQFVAFDEVDNVIEMGSGFGRAVEVLKKAHPHLNFYLVDLAPTLYACHQYLDSLFHESIVPYAETRTASRITARNKGSIAFLGPHQLQAIAPEGRSLSFNTAVLCNMEPPTVERYLSFIMRITDWVYLMEPRTDLTQTMYGLPSAPTFETYRSILEPEFRLVDRSEALKPLSVRRDFGGFESSFWSRSRRDS